MSSIQEMDFDFESLHMLHYWSKEELVAYISKLMNWLIDCIQKTHLLVSFRIIKDENFLLSEMYVMLIRIILPGVGDTKYFSPNLLYFMCFMAQSANIL